MSQAILKLKFREEVSCRARPSPGMATPTESQKERKRAYYIANRERILARAKEVLKDPQKHAEHRARVKAWYQRNKEHAMAKSEEWRKNNMDHCRITNGIRLRIYDSRKNLRGKLREAKRNARTRDLEWTLTDEEATEMFEASCSYCNRPGSEQSWNGIDRCDSEKPYAPANCVPACGRCNIAKKSMTVEEFIKMCREVAEYTKAVELD